MIAKPFALSVKVVVRNTEGEILLLRRAASSRNNAGKWDFPGGKMDAGESLDETLRREIAEETGLSVEPIRVLCTTQSESAKNRIAYLFLEASVEAGEFHLSTEHDAHQWIAAGDLASLDLCPQFLAVAESISQSLLQNQP
ncbi:MAG: NUDIX domain-containing protein [Candidatus Sumerlaeaceae bacterium]|nr:NUDIX domain-containing protein [Candidatus Sumerlaeaceae bacterium]